jgi:hypothetical protein
MLRLGGRTSSSVFPENGVIGQLPELLLHARWMRRLLKESAFSGTGDCVSGKV